MAAARAGPRATWLMARECDRRIDLSYRDLYLIREERSTRRTGAPRPRISEPDATRRNAMTEAADA